MFVERRRKITSDIPTASLADIGFLLIIFFLVITKFGTDKGIDLLLPPDGAIKEIPKSNIISIIINDSGELKIDNLVYPVDRVKGVVGAKAAANDLQVVTVKTTRQTPYATFIAVMDQLKASGVRKISVLEPDR